jgi:hypothetical protein
MVVNFCGVDLDSFRKKMGLAEAVKAGYGFVAAKD